MSRLPWLLPVLHLLAILLYSTNCFAQHFRPRLPEMLKWNSDWFKKIPSSPELFKTTPEIITFRGYPVEIHHVITDDGYILELHRIPAKSPNRRVVFIQHGVFQKSDCWVMNPSNRSLAFQLSDLGFDVWLGNTRGSSYSRNHTTLNATDLDFWDFAWDEVGNYDIPAAIDYVLKTTGQPTLVVICHSLGCAYLSIATINHPKLNDKIELQIALAPVGSCAHIMRNDLQLISQFIYQIEFFMRLLRLRQVADQSPTTERIQNFLCGRMYFQARICRELLTVFVGPDFDNFDEEEFPLIQPKITAGTSLNTMLQFFQNSKLGFVFNAFDYGSQENMKRYGTKTPKSYDLRQVTVPVHIFWSENDYLVNPKDIEWQAKHMGNLKSMHRVLDPKFNHLDFFCGKNVNEMVYNVLFTLLPSATIT